jgi:endogenous inhibitor of DNA gyrase (YacG/DUF329 family)
MGTMTKIKISKCPICGKPISHPVSTGYIFLENGRSQSGVPFCSIACASVFMEEEYANPVFQNRNAYELFRKLHPRIFRKEVEGKKVLFIEEGEVH